MTTTPPPELAIPHSEDASSLFPWSFDVNSVTNNFGNLFMGPDPPSDLPAPPPAPDPEHLTRSATEIAQAAGVELEHAGKAAQETIGKAAEEIGKGWGTLNTFLDDMLAVKPDPQQAAVVKDVATFPDLFPDLEGETLVDHFQCAMLQKYRCYLNNATPEKTFPLRGRMYVSNHHVAMYVTDDGGVFGRVAFGVTVPIADVRKVQKGAKTMLRLVTDAHAYIFAEFESDSHFSGALSLLEHMASAAANPTEDAKEETNPND